MWTYNLTPHANRFGGIGRGRETGRRWRIRGGLADPGRDTGGLTASETKTVTVTAR